ncbi:MAG TPA: IclR family transcriptional regulator [Solirubrobacteraceae bacterium]|jgi:IclR family pca regulon transcriptional regulator|nr:IclR family transcriptional regulator [Solirubrobacteraceae bacterium]
MPRMTSRAPAATADDTSTPPWALPILRGPRYSQSLERGLAILGCFTSEHPVLGIADIADELGMSRSTTHRYVTTLLALGYLEQGRSRKYRLGLRVTDLGMSALNSTGLRENVHPFLEELRERTGYTIGLAVLDGMEILYVDRARSWRRAERETDLGLHPGSRMPAYCTAMGKVLLAHLPEDVQRDLLAQLKLERNSPSTITSKQALRAELERVKEDGYAVNDQELRPGLHAIAVPVRDESREVVAAVGIAASPQAISVAELTDALGPHLISTAARISSRLGYRRNDEL